MTYRRNNEDEEAAKYAADSLTRQARGWKIEHVFDVSQTDGDALSDVEPVRLAGEAPEGFWDGLAAQVEANGFVLLQETPTHLRP